MEKLNQALKVIVEFTQLHNVDFHQRIGNQPAKSLRYRVRKPRARWSGNDISHRI